MNVIKVWYTYSDHWISMKTDKSALEVYNEAKTNGYVLMEGEDIVIPFSHITLIEKVD